MVGGTAHEVVLYGAPGCHLCAEARRGLQLLAVSTPFVFREVDIHSDPELERRWLFEIPVIEVDGRVVTQAPVDVEAVRRAFAGR
ncbi:MAG: glutaredoxin family protein [Dehalococcoidia bacterium]|nr:glutaredoxin family protein [Dehalococcoidia bacterium]